MMTKDHPAALVSVPASLIERALEELRMIRMKDSDAVYDTTLRLDLQLAQQSSAAPQAAGVRELTNEQIQTVMVEAIKEVRETVTDNVERAIMDADVARMERGPVDMGTTGWEVMRAVHRRLAALRAPSREPEGGVVDYGAFKIATDLHAAYEQLIYGLPKYLDAENLTDEENMIREAWITLDVTAHRLAALATREEASADHHESNLSMTNGELIEQALSHPPLEAEARIETPIDALVKTLRAQPPAREDAQPVGGEHE